jgi:hypothetical protein
MEVKNMAFILELQDGTRKEFSSANAATRAFGATSPMNWENARAFLEKRGITIIEWKSEKNSHGTSRTSGSNEKRLLARLIDNCARIDKEALQELKKRVEEIFPLAYASEEYQQELVTLSARMRELKNPNVTLENVLNRIREYWEKYAEEIFSERAGEIGKNENENEDEENENE